MEAQLDPADVQRAAEVLSKIVKLAESGELDAGAGQLAYLSGARDALRDLVARSDQSAS